MDNKKLFLFCTLLTLTNPLFSSEDFKPGRPIPRPKSPDELKQNTRRLNQKYQDDANNFIKTAGEKKYISIKNNDNRKITFTFEYDIPGFSGVSKGYRIDAPAGELTKKSILLPPGKESILVTILIGQSTRSTNRSMYNNNRSFNIVTDPRQTCFEKDPAPEADEV